MLICSQNTDLISSHLAARELKPALHLQEHTPGRCQLQPRLPPSKHGCTPLVLVGPGSLLCAVEPSAMVP